MNSMRPMNNVTQEWNNANKQKSMTIQQIIIRFYPTVCLLSAETSCYLAHPAKPQRPFLTFIPFIINGYNAKVNKHFTTMKLCL